jgi:gas vesicle protein
MPDFTKPKLENELNRLTEQLRKARDRVYQRGAPGYNMKQYKVGSIPYERAKKAFGPAKAEFDKIEEELQPKIDKLKNDLKQLETRKQEEKNTKKSKED